MTRIPLRSLAATLAFGSMAVAFNECWFTVMGYGIVGALVGAFSALLQEP